MDVAVLLGGRSPEHDVSLASAMQVLRHLDRQRWRVWPVLLDREGRWSPSRKPLSHADASPAPEATDHATHEHRDDWLPSDARLRLPPMRAGAALDWLLETAGVDVVFPVLHGPYGEDGTVQGLLELHDVPFVGSGCAASAVAMDKLRTRQAFAAEGIPQARAFEPPVGSGLATSTVSGLFAQLVEAVGVPAFAKVDTSGSTVGVARIATQADLEAFLRDNELQGGSRHDGNGHGGVRQSRNRRFRRWFAEQAACGEEITVAVLGNTGGTGDSAPVALPPVGIYPVDDEWFTNDAKYRPGATEEIVPPRGLSANALEDVQKLAVRCHEALVCDGMSRTDMIVTDAGPVVLETNTIPGMTANSLLPLAAKAHGLSFAALLDRMIDLALAPTGLHQPGANPAPNPARAEKNHESS
ncbi:MAG: hypothetical protein AB8H80_13680 [Planctomycetota bacterium]